MTILVKLCGPYIQSLALRSLIPSDLPVQRTTSPEMADLITSRPKTEQQSLFKTIAPLTRGMLP